MASSGKKKTTMAKLMRESRLRERKAAKQARKDDRKRNAAAGRPSWETSPVDDGELAHAGEPSVDSGVGLSD